MTTLTKEQKAFIKDIKENMAEYNEIDKDRICKFLVGFPELWIGGHVENEATIRIIPGKNEEYHKYLEILAYAMKADECWFEGRGSAKQMRLWWD